MGIHSNTKTQKIIMSAPAPKVKKAPAAHPKYSVMIATAITTLKDRTGSSRQAILKSIVANNKVDAAKAAVQVRLALKRGVAKGALKMARASGKGAGSYKVVKVEKPKKVKKAKKPKAKKGCQEASCQEACCQEASCQEASCQEASCQEASCQEARCQEGCTQEVNHNKTYTSM